MKALRTSLVVALWTAVLATIFGTLAALGLERMRGWPRRAFDALIYVAIMVPGVVIGIATLIAFVTVFDAVNPFLAGLFGDAAPRLAMGLPTVVGAHVLFNLAVVILIVRARFAGLDRSLIEASEDLYATPFGTFRQVVLPMIFPAILAELPAQLHLQLRGLHHRLLRLGRRQHAADLHLLVDQARHHARRSTPSARWCWPSR